MIKQRKIELLAPAKNLECGIEAVNHGADAVYIGAPKFGARAAAVNSLEDIAALVEHAHLYNARIYVTVNTILKEEELAETEKMIWELYRIGVDALIVQDMGITRLNLPPIPLHGSTQMDNRTPEKVRFLADAGFRQVVLARELSLQEIRRIHETCPETPLEVFVHGALCVSYSGQCYVSQACFGRSANRGECAQFCRLPFSLVDADGKTIVRDKHLLSLKDLNQSEVLEDLLDAGASSLKIEGRLKDVSYVKNVTAAYRSKLDAIFARRKEYVRASSGTCRFDFTPQLDKSFSRGFTHYFLQGRDREISSFDTPKSLGEEMGTMKEQRGNYLTVAGVKPFHNGDGVCFLDEQGRLQGFRINRVDGNKLYPVTKTSLIINDAGEPIGDVEAGAQVNRIEKIKVNGVELKIVSKEVDISVPNVPVYSLAKSETADSGYSATYQLTKDGTPVGDKINIAKDMVVQSGQVSTVVTDDTPVQGYKVGDKYIDLLLANTDNEHIYILVSDLVDVYSAGSGIVITGNSVAIDTEVVALKGESYTKSEADNRFLQEHQDISGKADKATTLAGYGITDALSYEELV